MDLVPQFNDLLRKHDSQPLKPHVFRLQDVDEFLKEAYRINKHISELNSYLRSIRQSYLSTTHPPRRKQLSRSEPAGTRTPFGKNDDSKYFTDEQRTLVDAEAKQLLRELNAAISQLSDTEQIRQDAQSTIALKKRATRGLGALGRWAAGGAITAKSPEELEEEAKANAIKMHREGVIWYLQRHLAGTGRYQSDMMEIRLTREVEKSKSILYKARGAIGISAEELSMNGSTLGAVGGSGLSYKKSDAHQFEELDRKEVEQQLSPEQLQLFAQENVDMLKHYEDTLDQVRTAERSLVEISELQTTLAGNLATQSAHIEQLVMDSVNTTEDVGKGNKELKRATERQSTARMLFYGTVALCSFVIVTDLIF